MRALGPCHPSRLLCGRSFCEKKRGLGSSKSPRPESIPKGWRRVAGGNPAKRGQPPVRSRPWLAPRRGAGVDTAVDSMFGSGAPPGRRTFANSIPVAARFALATGYSPSSLRDDQSLGRARRPEGFPGSAGSAEVPPGRSPPGFKRYRDDCRVGRRQTMCSQIPRSARDDRPAMFYFLYSRPMLITRRLV